MLTSDDFDDVLVTVAHPAGDVEVPLADWIRVGPGPRSYVGIVRARWASTGEDIPVAEVPLQYHNSVASRRRQRAGELEQPWGPPPADEPSAG